MIIETALALIIIFAVLVIFHEFGHFTAAKLVGVRVEEFALGFGPKLISLFKKGDTEYTLHPYPLGGFVKLAGMEPGEENIPDGFQAQTLWKRALVIFSGPFASFVLAVIVFVFMGVYFGFPLGKTENRVGQVFPQTEAARIGLRAGDRILSINGTKITDGGQMTNIIHANPGNQLNLTIRRDKTTLRKTSTPTWTIFYLGATVSFSNPHLGVVDNIEKSSPAGRAGIQQDDKLIAINDKKIGNGKDMVAAIKANGGKPVTIDLERNNKTVQIHAKPEVEIVNFANTQWHFPGAYISEGKSAPSRGTSAWAHTVGLGDSLISINGKKVTTGESMVKILRSQNTGPLRLVVVREVDKVNITLNPASADFKQIDTENYYAIGLFGFVPLEKLVKTGFVDSVSKGLKITGGLAITLVKTLTSKEIKENVGGPLAIASMTRSSVALGPYYVLSMLGSLSMSLAFINLVPIPLLDGGHLAIIALEGIRRKRLTMEQMQIVQLIGLAIVGMIMVLVFFSDITKLAGGKLPQ